MFRMQSITLAAALAVGATLTGWGVTSAGAETNLTVYTAIEAEDLKVIAKSRNFTFWLQPSDGFSGGNWSKPFPI